MFNFPLNSLLSIGLGLIIMLASSISVAESLDPTRPFGVSGAGGSNSSINQEDAFTLTSIIHGDGIHTAVINGKIYKMFDYVGEYRITAINNHSVVLRSKSERLKINVFKSKGFTSSVIETQ